MKGNVLFIDSPHQSMEKALHAMDFHCIKKNITYDELLQTAQDYVGYIIRSKFIIDKQIIDKSSQLRFIARIGAGMENIDIDYAKSKNIACINSPEGNADAVAEYVIASILSLLRNLKKADTEVRQGIWDRRANRGIELCGKTVGIIGYGNMGMCVAKKLKAFGCTLLAYDKYKKNFGDDFVKEVNLKQIQENADIISIHINYLPENHYYVNGKWINDFHKNIFLINTSRGKVLNTKDLVFHLQKGKVIAAALDVLEYEDIQLNIKPPKEWDDTMHYLAQSENIILSPHIAGQSMESSLKHAQVLIDKIKKEIL
ncbi:MAG: NAD(P)-dependent oxidoreductase [Bacteroidales bacterium]|nr:NAD(P)-dependent oxidoreductase [Bacteroidales bacterium]